MTGSINPPEALMDQRDPMVEAAGLKALGSIQEQPQRCKESQKLRNIKTFHSVGLSRPSQMGEAGAQHDAGRGF